MKLFTLLKIGIVLGHTLQGKLLHQVDELRGGDIFSLEILNLLGIGSREKHNLLIFRHYFYNLGDDRAEID